MTAPIQVQTNTDGSLIRLLFGNFTNGYTSGAAENFPRP